jgi:hypothetical protein
MKRRSTLSVSALIAALLTVAAVSAEPPVTVQTEISFLLGYVQGSGCEFRRNGTWYESGEAEAHLRDKYRILVASDQIRTTEDFIEGVATYSSITGQPYTVRCQGGITFSSNQWLRKELTRLRTP